MRTLPAPARGARVRALVPVAAAAIAAGLLAGTPNAAVPDRAAASVSAASVAAASVSAASVAAAAGSDGVSVDRVLRDPRIAESSGLVASRAHPGVLWTHNDSGNPPLLYALGRDGRTTATVRVNGAADRDWEALAPLRGPHGSPLLAVGDIGDNTASRTSVEIDIVTEPGALRSVSERPVRTLRLRYPDGATDAETLLADPRTGRLFIVTKGLLGSSVYVVPAAAWPGDGAGPSTVEAVLQRVGDVSLSLVTDGCVLPDGRVLLRTYSTLALLPALTATPRATGGHLSPLATLALPVQRQGEGLALLDATAGVVALSSEGVGQPVLRLGLPAGFLRAGAPAETAATAAAGSGPASLGGTGSGGTGSGSTGSGGTGSGGTGSGGTASGAGAATGSGDTRTVRLVVLGLLVLLAIGAGVGAGAGAGARRRRR